MQRMLAAILICGFSLLLSYTADYGDKHLSDSSYQEMLMTRALATVQRDKLHPSVLVWSVGNENPLPQTCVKVGNYVGAIDPSRPADVPAPFRPFMTQYDTYLMKYREVVEY